MGHRKMPAYGEREHGGRYILDEYEWSRNHCRAVTIRRWKRDLKKYDPDLVCRHLTIENGVIEYTKGTWFRCYESSVSAG